MGEAAFYRGLHHESESVPLFEVIVGAGRPLCPALGTPLQSLEIITGCYNFYRNSIGSIFQALPGPEAKTRDNVSNLKSPHPMHQP